MLLWWFLLLVGVETTRAEPVQLRYVLQAGADVRLAVELDADQWIEGVYAKVVEAWTERGECEAELVITAMGESERAQLEALLTGRGHPR